MAGLVESFGSFKNFPAVGLGSKVRFRATFHLEAWKTFFYGMTKKTLSDISLRKGLEKNESDLGFEAIWRGARRELQQARQVTWR